MAGISSLALKRRLQTARLSEDLFRRTFKCIQVDPEMRARAFLKAWLFSLFFILLIFLFVFLLGLGRNGSWKRNLKIEGGGRGFLENTNLSQRLISDPALITWEKRGSALIGQSYSGQGASPANHRVPFGIYLLEWVEVELLYFLRSLFLLIFIGNETEEMCEIRLMVLWKGKVMLWIS